MASNSNFHDAEMSSIATSSALVSETILDSTPSMESRYNGYFSSGDHCNKKIDVSNEDERGVSHHSLSPDRMSDILSQIQIASNYYNKDDEECSNGNLKPSIHPAHYHASLGEKKRLKNRELHQHQIYSSSDSQLQPSINDSSTESSVGIIASTRKWLSEQRLKRQKQALERAVEEQRGILLQQTIQKNRNPLRNCQSLEDDNGSIIGLGGNSTFKSITSSDTLMSVSLSVCGNKYFVEDDSYDVSNDGVENSKSCENDCNDISIRSGKSDDLWSHDEECNDAIHKVHHSKEVIRIGDPCETFSGQGMAVQLEIVDDICPQIDKDEKLAIKEEHNGIPFILTYDQMMEIAKKGLPASILFAKWTRLYSLLRDGDSFEGSFLRKVQGQLRTLLVIETTKHEVMAAYSNSPWENRNNSMGREFYGSAQACLFSIDKISRKVNAFKWSGLNRYIQICDVHAKMLAFGGGGDAGEFGLCVENDFSIGSTGSCETFRNDPLCTEDRFEVLNVECWGFMPVFA